MGVELEVLKGCVCVHVAKGGDTVWCSYACKPWWWLCAWDLEKCGAGFRKVAA